MGSGGSKDTTSVSLTGVATSADRASAAAECNGAHHDDGHVNPAAALSADVSTPGENAAKRVAYACLRSPYADRGKARPGKRVDSNDSRSSAGSPISYPNLIEEIYNEDFETIDHIQAMRLPPMVTQQLRNTIRSEAERRCTEPEKTMARCLQDKMWTSWKCQKERDAYYYCVRDIEQQCTRPDPNDPKSVDMLTAFRWKYNLGVFHGELIGRNNIMKRIWNDHYPERELPHPWVKDA